MSLDSEQPDEAKLDIPEETQDDAGSFWNGNPDELPEEIQPVYKNLQADYTRKSQEIAAQRKEAEEALAVYEALQSPDDLPQILDQLADIYGQDFILSALGYSVEQDDPKVSYEDDPVASVRQELEDLKGQLTAQQQQAQEEAMLDLIESKVTEQFDSLGDQLSDKEKEIVTSLALAAQYQTPDGFPDVRKAYEDYSSVLGERTQKYVESKRAPRAPSAGAPGTEDFDWRNEDKRRELMAAMLEANTSE